MFRFVFCSIAVLVLASAHGVASEKHQHTEQVVDSRPVIRLLPIELEQPRRVLCREDGSLLISDWGAGKVVAFRGQATTTVVDNLHQPSGLAEDADGNIFVSVYADGEPDKGSIIRLSQPIGTTTWDQQVIANGLSGPTDLAIDAAGHIFVAEYTANRISRVNPDGSIDVGIASLTTPSSVVLDKKGRLFATNSQAGTVVSIPAAGEPIVLCSGLDRPSDLTLNENDDLIAVSYKSNSVVRVDTTKSSFKRIARVPEGTIGIGFRKDGNFVLVNWQLQTATQVTHRLLIDCPHCDGKIPVRLKPKSRSDF